MPDVFFVADFLDAADFRDVAFAEAFFIALLVAGLAAALFVDVAAFFDDDLLTDGVAFAVAVRAADFVAALLVDVVALFFADGVAFAVAARAADFVAADPALEPADARAVFVAFAVVVVFDVDAAVLFEDGVAAAEGVAFLLAVRAADRVAAVDARPPAPPVSRVLDEVARAVGVAVAEAARAARTAAAPVAAPERVGGRPADDAPPAALRATAVRDGRPACGTASSGAVTGARLASARRRSAT